MQTEPGAANPARDKYTTVIFWLLAVVVVATAFSFRMSGADKVMRPDRTIRFGDNDTMRRLERLRAIDEAPSYPVTEIKDGFPDGTISHWTRPFDWCLQALNPILLPFVPGARGYEAAAVLAGPVLGTLCVILFLWFAVRLLGRFPGLLASLFYALQFPLLAMSGVGNGDHQNLQHLFLLVFGWLWVLDRAGKVGAGWAPLSGFALGMGIWISTESMVMFLTWVAVTAVMALVRPPSRDRFRSEILRGGAVLITLLVGMAVEQTNSSAIEWDRVSWFQIYPVLVFFAFLLAARCLEPIRGRIWMAAAIAVGAGLLGLLTGFGTEVRIQLATFEDTNVWLQNAVSEFRSSLWNGYEFSAAEGVRRFTPLFLGLPVFLVCVSVARPLPGAGRVVLVGLAACGSGLAAWEVKLGHLFAMWFPVVTVIAGIVLRNRLLPDRGPGRSIATVLFAVMLVGLCMTGTPNKDRPEIEIGNQGVRELCTFLRSQTGNREGSVLTNWEHAGAILYLADWPVVASGYHRNLDGTKDSYRFFTSQPEESDVALEILRQRRVRFVAVWYDRLFLRTARVVLDSSRVFLQQDGRTVKFTESATNSLFWRLRYEEGVVGYKLRYRSTIGESQPMFQVYEVTR